jgi:hypothetical protein
MSCLSEPLPSNCCRQRRRHESIRLHFSLSNWVGPVGLEPTTYGIQVEAERHSALLVISALRLGRIGILSRIESSLTVTVQRRLMGVKRGLPYH